jgi:hypothetical protein
VVGVRRRHARRVGARRLHHRRQEWAVRIGLAAGLALSLEGPVFTRGTLGPLRPWLPSGTLL